MNRCPEISGSISSLAQSQQFGSLKTEQRQHLGVAQVLLVLCSSLSSTQCFSLFGKIFDNSITVLEMPKRPKSKASPNQKQNQNSVYAEEIYREITRCLYGEEHPYV